MLLVGRSREITVLHELVGAVCERGAALVLRGQPGIGKSALLTDAAEFAQASGLRLLSTAGAESEANLPYAGLHRLLRPVRGQLGVLPTRQREALQAVLGITEAAVPDGYLVALAVLNLLAEIAETAPVVVIAEDAHWLDSSTTDVLTFLGRRLESEPILLLASARSGITGWLDAAGLPELIVPPLSARDAAALLDATAPDLTAALRQRLLAEAEGNPLALIELPTAVHGADDTAILVSPWLPLTARLESVFTRRFAVLPDATRAVLEVAALNDSTDLSETLTATRVLTCAPVTLADLSPVARARLITVHEEQVVFDHPLIRSAIHQATEVGRRRQVHRSLAAVLGNQPDRKTWHLAAASDRPDEDIAAALDAVAARAQHRGSGAAAVAALEQAARLSPDKDRRTDRLLRAADAAVELGRPETVHQLLDAAGKLDLARQQRARLAWIRAAFDDGLRAGNIDDASTLADLAESVAAEGDTDLAVRILWSAALRCFWTEPGEVARHKIVTVAEQLPIDPLDARLLAILGYAEPISRATVVIERSQELLGHAVHDSQTVRLVGSVAVLVGTFDVAIAQSAASLPGLREQGRLHLLARALAAQAWAATQVADLMVALPAAEEAGRLAAETGQPFLLGIIRATQAKIAALRGRLAEAADLAAEAEQIAMPVAARNVLATAQHARALAALAAGDYPQALTRLLRMHDITDPSHQLALSCHTIIDLADAVSHSETPYAATTVLAQLEAAAKTSTAPPLHDGLRLAKAVMAPPDEAGSRFHAALAADLTRRPFTRARTQLAYGEWLRRQRHTAESRQYLRAARDTFDALGTSPWSERARRELRATGERSNERQGATSDLLTPQELQIAQMAAQGLTNREIGKRLYISHRTVGAHLARTYTKLGVTSRVQLHSALH
ncbi:AAA family ATPase [Nocardia sp. NPDC052278]|uniref:AAA family ATPase n=1 Tax=unclassified Nocardia TaxID=2637762 RepID=UPI0036C58DC5